MTPKSQEEVINSLKGMDPHQQMMKAIEYDLLPIVKHLLEGGIDLKKNVGGGTPAGKRFVSKCVEHGRTDILKYLLDNGCEMEHEDYLLGEAIQKGHYEIAKFLVDEYDATVNDQEGDAYLQMAVDRDNMDMVKLVYDKLGCEWYEYDWWKDTVLGQNIDSEIIKYIMKNIPQAKQDVIELYQNYKTGMEILEDYVHN
jgi:hypothetical protein